MGNDSLWRKAFGMDLAVPCDNDGGCVLGCATDKGGGCDRMSYERKLGRAWRVSTLGPATMVEGRETWLHERGSPSYFATPMRLTHKSLHVGASLALR